jgi:glycosyltransferase involved in cell wall biosynthesis
VPSQAGPYASEGALCDWQVAEWVNLCAAVERSAEFDVIHSHAYLWSLPLASVSQCPVVSTLHVTPYDDEARLRAMFPSAHVTAISAYQWSAYPHLASAPVIHHGVDETMFEVNTRRGDYLCFLGRFTPGKGPLEAIETARRLEMPLLLAGPENDYYRDHVAPLVDGDRVRYVGHVSPAERSALLSGARALLYPIKSPEPFGLVLVEAMMCGTPVAGFALGAVAELVEGGRGGVLVPPGGDLAAAAADAMMLDRSDVSARARARFTARRMAAEYVAVYDRVRVAAPELLR